MLSEVHVLLDQVVDGFVYIRDLVKILNIFINFL